MADSFQVDLVISERAFRWNISCDLLTRLIEDIGGNAYESNFPANLSTGFWAAEKSADIKLNFYNCLIERSQRLINRSLARVVW